MRPKVLISVLLFGCIAAAVAFFLWSPNRNQVASPVEPVSPSEQLVEASSNNTELAMKSETSAQSKEVAATNQEATVADEDDPMNMTPEAKQKAYVAARVEELEAMGSADDLDSLNTLLSELGNRDPEIRKAALDAVVQFDSLDAIPKLEDAELQVDDPHEKAAIADAIAFLQLPPMKASRAAAQSAPASH